MSLNPVEAVAEKWAAENDRVMNLDDEAAETCSENRAEYLSVRSAGFELASALKSVPSRSLAVAALRGGLAALAARPDLAADVAVLLADLDRAAAAAGLA